MSIRTSCSDWQSMTPPQPCGKPWSCITDCKHCRDNRCTESGKYTDQHNRYTGIGEHTDKHNRYSGIWEHTDEHNRYTGIGKHTDEHSRCTGIEHTDEHNRYTGIGEHSDEHNRCTESKEQTDQPNTFFVCTAYSLLFFDVVILGFATITMGRNMAGCSNGWLCICPSN